MLKLLCSTGSPLLINFLIHHLSSGHVFLFSELKTKYSEKEGDKTECVHVDVNEGIYYNYMSKMHSLLFP